MCMYENFKKIFPLSAKRHLTCMQCHDNWGPGHKTKFPDSYSSGLQLHSSEVCAPPWMQTHTVLQQ
jgi:hypothetical protein